MAASVSASAARSTSASTTVAPRRASSAAPAAPIPRAPPVMRATLPSSVHWVMDDSYSCRSAFAADPGSHLQFVRPLDYVQLIQFGLDDFAAICGGKRAV